MDQSAVVVIPDTPPPRPGPKLVTLIGLAVAKVANIDLAIAASASEAVRGLAAPKKGGPATGGATKKVITRKTPRAKDARAQVAPRQVRRPAAQPRQPGRRRKTEH